MRWNVWMVPCLVASAWASSMTAVAQQPPREDAGRPPVPQAAAAVASIDPTGARMRELLEAWAGQSTRLKSLDVQIKRVDKAPAAWGDTEYFEGRAMFKSPNLAWLDFSKITVDDQKKTKVTPFERIVCTGTEVWQYKSDTKQIYIYKLEKQARQRALQEGPLPFLFNFRADEARTRYRMQLLKEDKTKGTYIIGVLPLMNLDKECFSQAMIELDSKYLLATRIILVRPDGKTTQDFALSHIKANKDIPMENFKGQRLPKPWTIHVNDESGAPPGTAPGQPAVSSRPPALGKGIRLNPRR